MCLCRFHPSNGLEPLERACMFHPVHFLTLEICFTRIVNAGGSQQVTSPGGTTQISTTQHTYAARPAFTDAILQDIARLADEVRNIHDPQDADQKRRELGQKVRQFRVQLGLPALDEDFQDQNSESIGSHDNGAAIFK